MKKAKSTIEGGEQWSCARYFLVQPHNRRSDIQITCSRKTIKSVDNIRHEAHTHPYVRPTRQAYAVSSAICAGSPPLSASATARKASQ